jgi:putative MATE family efflux protein
MSSAASAARRGVNFTQWSSRAELVRLIAILAVPVVVTNSLQTLITFTDTRMCSILGAPALAAMSVGRSGMFIVIGVFMGLGVGIVAYVARLTGAGMPDQARVYATLGLASSGVAGLLLMGLGFLIGQEPIESMVASGNPGMATTQNQLAEQYAWSFLAMLFLGLVFMGVLFAAVNVFNALGRTAFPMWLLVISNIANLAGNWLFIPGPGIEGLRHALHIPALGVAGSALSTNVTNGLAMLMAIVWLYRGHAVSFNWSLFSHPLAKVWDMLKVGLPVTLQMSMRSISMLAILKMITYLPQSVIGQSALQVGIQVESVAFMPAFAFMTAAATLVGQNLGAHRPREARSSALYCLVGNQAFMWVLGGAIWLWPEFFVRLFIGSNAPEVIAPTAGFLKVLALCLPGLGAGQTLMGALRGAGDTPFTVWISVVSMYCVRLPLACLLAYETIPLGHAGLVLHGYNFGLPGIWWAMTLSVYVETGMTVWRFLSGKWARVKLRYE